MSMTLAEFKAKLGVNTLPMYKSTTGSGRHACLGYKSAMMKAQTDCSM